MADRLEEPARQLADSIAHLAIRERSALWRYNVAVVSAAAALGARFLFEPWLGGHAPYVTYMVAVAATVWLAGFWPALLTAALGIPGAMIFLRDSPYPWTAHIIGMAIYVMAMVAIASLGRSMRVARAKAQEAADEARLGQEEAALAWREWEQTFDTIPDLIAIIDTSHKIVRANRAMAARLKINASACPGLACHHAVHDLDAPIQKCPHALAMADGCEHVAEVYEERLGGHFLISCTPMRDDAGRMIGTVHVARDITERIEAEEELRRSELFYRQTLESIPGMVFTTRADGYCDYQSQQWVDYTGVPMDEHMGSGWSKLLHPDDQPRALQAWNDAVAERAPYDLEYRVRRHDGQYEWFHVRARPIRDLSGRVVRWFGVVTNVEQFRRSQAALQESRRHLQAQAVELTRSNQDLEEFAHVASHDLKEPLGVMTMYLALLRKKHAAALDEEARQFIGHAVDAVGRMGRLINDLLAYSRVGRKTEGFTPTDMEDVL
ncbi:MAG: PAS domain-containing protein, partial [Planctomycetaceae bacterium]